jgi:hypothetical protein
MSPQTEIPGTERKADTRLQQLSEQLREQLVHNAAGRTREKELRRQILSEVLGQVPEYKDLVEQLLALPAPALKYVDGEGIEIESIATFELKAKVHPTGEQEPAVGEGVTPPAPRKRAKADSVDKEFDEDSIPDPDPEDDARAAAAAQLESGVAEDEDGDVVPPEKSAKPRKKAKGKKARRK